MFMSQRTRIMRAFFLSLCLLFAAYVQAQDIYVEQLPRPTFDIHAYVDSNARYPASALRDHIDGKVVVKFVINIDGSVSNFEVTESLGPDCDSEALRVLRKMPRWVPGVQADKPVKVVFHLPVTFKSAGNEQKDKFIKNAHSIYEYAEQPAAPGYALTDWLRTQLKYPPKAIKKKVQGTSMIQFVVNEDGSISDCKVKYGIGYGCDREALRLIRSMPPWKPAIQDGRAVRMYCELSVTFYMLDKLPATFHLQEDKK